MFSVILKHEGQNLTPNLIKIKRCDVSQTGCPGSNILELTVRGHLARRT